MKAFINVTKILEGANTSTYKEIWAPIDPSSNLAADLPSDIVKFVDNPTELFHTPHVARNIRRWTTQRQEITPNEKRLIDLINTHKTELREHLENRTGDYDKIQRTISSLQEELNIEEANNIYHRDQQLPNYGHITLKEEFKDYQALAKQSISWGELYGLYQVPKVHAAIFDKMDEFGIKTLVEEVKDLGTKGIGTKVNFIGRPNIERLTKTLKWRKVHHDYNNDRTIPRSSLRVVISHNAIETSEEAYNQAKEDAISLRKRDHRYKQLQSIREILSVGYSWYDASRFVEGACKTLLLEYVEEKIKTALPELRKNILSVPAYDIKIKVRNSRKVVFEYASILQDKKSDKIPLPENLYSKTTQVKGTPHENIMRLIRLMKEGNKDVLDTLNSTDFARNQKWEILEDPYLYVIQKVMREHPKTSVGLAYYVINMAAKRVIAGKYDTQSFRSKSLEERIPMWEEYAVMIDIKDPVKAVLEMEPVPSKTKYKFVRKDANVSKRSKGSRKRKP